MTLTSPLFGAGPVAHRDGIVLEEFVYTKADFPQCHASTILELPDGELLCAFFGGTEEGDPDVEIRLSRKPVGGTWSAPISVADGLQSETKRLPTWNPVLFQPHGGEIMLFYKVGPNPMDWWGMAKTSGDGGHTWSDARRLEDGLLGPIKNKPIQLANGNILAGSSTEDDGWRIHFELSTDRGKTWRNTGPIDNGESGGGIQPTLLDHSTGRIQALCRNRTEDDTGRIVETWSDDGGLHWSPLKKTSLPNNNSGIDGVTMKDGRFLLAYNHSTREQPGMGHKGRGVLNVAVSKDGVNWEAALVLDYLDMPERHFAYPAVIQTRDGLVHIVYTWHRRRIKHVAIDPTKLATYPIEDGHWPVERVPLVESEAPDPSLFENLATPAP